MAACIIRLDRRPLSGQHCVSISGLAPSVDPAKLERCFRECGGPLENLIIHETQFGTGSSNYATAQFFCEADCERCRHHCDGLLLNGRRMQVTRLTKTSGWSANGAFLELPATKCIELMNHYLGFNGWTSELLGLTAVAVPASTAGATAVGFEARVCVRVMSCGMEVIGSSVGDSGDVVAGVSGGEINARRKKTAVTNAIKATLSRLTLVLFPSGKVVVKEVGAGAVVPTTVAPGPEAVD